MIQNEPKTKQTQLLYEHQNEPARWGDCYKSKYSIYIWAYISLIKKLYNLNMGCNSFKQNVVVEVVYCGGVGWSLPAKRVCEAIKLKLPKCTIDCRPEQVFTGVLEINLLLDRKQKKFVYKGNKDQVTKNTEQISQQVQKAYKDV